MNKQKGFFSSDTSKLQNVVSKTFSIRNLKISLGFLIFSIGIAVIGTVLIIAFFLTRVVGTPPEKQADFDKIEKSYSSLVVPSEFEKGEKIQICASSLDSCAARMDYRYNYSNSISSADAILLMKNNLIHQGFNFTDATDGRKADITVSIGNPKEASIPANKSQLQVIVGVRSEHE